ncbi:hypothetical protein pipiens_011218 [Culex pipiens pipiens]|uniref:Transposase DDE domain-containing protein n=1 Tax=Culex pipiens pipiens TaxID=38569 RepID=A0ABD1D7C4_CULPP
MRRGKELGKKSAKRRLLFEEIPRTSPNRRHDGVKRSFKVFLKIVIRNVVSCIEHAKRMAIMAMNIVNVLKRKLGRAQVGLTAGCLRAESLTNFLMGESYLGGRQLQYICCNHN